MPDPPPNQHANRPLPPTPRSSGVAPAPVQPTPSAQAQPQQQTPPQRNSQNMFKPMVRDYLQLEIKFLLKIKNFYCIYFQIFRDSENY